MKNPLLIALLFFSIQASAQHTAPLITDRPDFTESPQVVPKGSVQVEMGSTRTEAGSASISTYGEGLIRYGLSQRVEIRIGAPSYFSGDLAGNGLGDSSIGAKMAFGQIFGEWELGLIASISLPTGADNLTSERIDPSFILAAGRDLSDRISVGTQIGGEFVDINGETRFNSAATLVAGVGISEYVGGFAEIAAEFPDGSGAEAQFHAGIVFAVGSLGQFDIHGGFGLTDAAPDSFIGAGFSFRR